MTLPPDIPQCQYIKVNGVRCGSPALKGQRFCYFHYQIERPRNNYIMPPFEDATAIQFALIELARAVLNDAVDRRKATLLAYILQTAVSNLKRMHPETEWSNFVRELPSPEPPADESPDPPTSELEP